MKPLLLVGGIITGPVGIYLLVQFFKSLDTANELHVYRAGGVVCCAISFACFRVFFKSKENSK